MLFLVKKRLRCDSLEHVYKVTTSSWFLISYIIIQRDGSGAKLNKKKSVVSHERIITGARVLPLKNRLI